MVKTLLYAISLAFFSCIMQGQEACAQDLVFEGPCDFGTIREQDGPALRKFTFRNASRDTVVICDISTACRCMTSEPSFERVPPGGTGTVSLRFDPAYRSGDFSYTAVLWYSDRTARRSVEVKGTVVPMKHPISEDQPYSLGEGLYVSHLVLPYGSIRCGETKRMFFRYGNGTDSTMTIAFEIEGCCAHTIEMQRSVTLAPDQREKMYVSITMPEGYSGSHVNRIWPVVNGRRLDKPILVKMKTVSNNQ